jgi:hypothetical protein
MKIHFALAGCVYHPRLQKQDFLHTMVKSVTRGSLTSWTVPLEGNIHSEDYFISFQARAEAGYGGTHLSS